MSNEFKARDSAGIRVRRVQRSSEKKVAEGLDEVARGRSNDEKAWPRAQW